MFSDSGAFSALRKDIILPFLIAPSFVSFPNCNLTNSRLIFSFLACLARGDNYPLCEAFVWDMASRCECPPQAKVCFSSHPFIFNIFGFLFLRCQNVFMVFLKVY